MAPVREGIENVQLLTIVVSQFAVMVVGMGSSPIPSFFTGVRGSFVVALSAFEDSFVHSDGNSVDSYCPMLGYV